MSDAEYIQVTHRELPFTTFDADNHLYENQDALTKFLPPEYQGAIKYVDIEGRTKLAIKDRITNFIPNPTFAKVAVARWVGSRHHAGRRRVRHFTGKSLQRKKMVVMPGIDAFFDPEPRLAAHEGDGDRPDPPVADARQRRSRSGWPTTPTPRCAVIHALNEWMHEHWTYVYSDAIYSTPIISLAAGRRPRDRGARVHPRARREDLPHAGRRRCPRGRDASRSRFPSSTRSGSACRSSASWSACTPVTPATAATSTSGRASATRR